MDKDEIKKHYENVKSQSITGRNLLETIKIRKFNNFIKSVLIKEYVNPYSNILDIGCGHGGDLAKYNRIGINEYFGIDISSNSIIEAKRRYTGSTIKFSAEFSVADCYNEDLNTGKEFDFISIQFSLHYAFSTEASLKTTFQNLKRNLKIGGIVIATIPNSECLLRRYQKYGNGFSNPYYEINFKDNLSTIEKTKRKIGISYEFYLKDSIDNCVEYLIDKDILDEYCEEYGFEILKNESFIEYFNEKVKKYLPLHDIIIGDQLTQDEIYVYAIYSVLVLKLKG